MNNPQLADKILSAMIELNTGDSVKISQKIGEKHVVILDMMKSLHSTYPSQFRIGSGKSGGYGDSIDVFIRPSQLDVMKSFLEKGGYTAQHEEDAKEKYIEKYKRGLEITNLEDTIKRSKRAERIAIIAIIIAGITVIVEIGRSCKWWE